MISIISFSKSCQYQDLVCIIDSSGRSSQSTDLGITKTKLTQQQLHRASFANPLALIQTLRTSSSKSLNAKIQIPDHPPLTPPLPKSGDNHLPRTLTSSFRSSTRSSGSSSRRPTVVIIPPRSGEGSTREYYITFIISYA